MVITWYGEGAFRCQSGELTILTDPVDAKTGLSAPRFTPTILLKTLTPFPPEPTEGIVFQNAGEYDAMGISVKGHQIKKESTESFLKTMYVVDFEGIRLCFLGHLSQPLDAGDLEPLENIDVLFVPAGGKPFLDQEKAVKLIHQIEPRVVIPSFFKIPGLKRQSADLSPFMKEFGAKAEPQEKFTFKRKDLREKGTDIVVLKV